MKKGLLIFVFSLFVFVFLPLDVNANFDKEEKIEKASEKREKYGFSKEKKNVEKLIEDKKFSKKFNMFMTEAEEQELEIRMEKQKNGSGKLLTFLKNNKNLDKAIKGKYLDQKNGGVLKVIISEEMQKDKEIKKEIEKLKAEKLGFEVEIIDNEYGEEELYAITDNIPKKIGELKKVGVEIAYSYPTISKQKLVIGIYENDFEEEKNIEILSNHLNIDKKMIEIKNTKKDDSLIEKFTTASEYEHLLKSGKVIYTVKKHCTKECMPSCSIGYSALKGGVPFIVTAGHCFNWTNGQLIYQGGSYVGHSSSSFQNKNGEAQAIYVENSTRITNEIFGAVKKITAVEVAGNDKEGDISCHVGATTGIQCGELLSKKFNDYFDTEDYSILYENVRVNDMYSWEGDSGAAIVSNVNDGATLKGILLGGVGVDKNNKTIDFTLYTHVTHITNELGLIPVTWK